MLIRECGPNSRFWEEQIGKTVTHAEFRYSRLELTLDSALLNKDAAHRVTKAQSISTSPMPVFFFRFFSDCSNRKGEYDI